MIMFDAGDVRAHEARTLLYVALGEFLFFTQFAEPITNYHGRDYSIEADGRQAEQVLSAHTNISTDDNR
jgi:hypothetical protein